MPSLRTAFLLVLVPVLHLTPAHAAEVKVLSSTGVQSALEELVPEFERATGHKVSIVYDTANLLLGRIKAGEAADVAILTRSAFDEVVKSGKAAPGAGQDLARSGIGVAVQPGQPKPDLGTPEAFKRTLLAARSVAYTGTGASGVHFVKVLDRLGIAEEVKAKAKVPSGGFVGDLVAKGEAELAVQQIPELLGVRGIQFVGPFPAELQNYTTFTAGVLTGSAHGEAASALVSFLRAPAAAQAFRTRGFEP